MKLRLRKMAQYEQTTSSSVALSLRGLLINKAGSPRKTVNGWTMGELPWELLSELREQFLFPPQG